MVLDTGNISCSHHHQPSHNSFHVVNWELSPQNIDPLSSPLPAPGIHHSTSCLYNVDYLKCLLIFLSSNNIAFVQSRSVRLFETPWTAASRLPVLHRLPEPAQTHVHRVSDAIQPPHPLSPSSPVGILSESLWWSDRGAGVSPGDLRRVPAWRAWKLPP